MLPIDSELQEYARQHTTLEPDLVQELVRVSEKELEHTEMLSGPVVGGLLRLLVSISGAKNVLEIGTFTGYSALMMAEALPDGGKIITCEVTERYAAIAQTFFGKSRHKNKIILMLGEALKTIDQLEGPFDMVFLDADKQNYPNYYQVAIPMLKPGGLFIVDNVMWSGEILNPKEEKPVAIDRLNKQILADEKVEQVMLTERDGITIVRKL